MRIPLLLAALVLSAPSARAAGLESAFAAAGASWRRPALFPAAAAAVPGKPVANVVPPWMEVLDEGPAIGRAKDGVLAGLRLLYETPTGAGYERLLTRDGARITVSRGGSLAVMDSDLTVSTGPDFVNSREDWQMAVFMGHELEHIRQARLELKGEGVRGVRECAAFLMQSRVWIESGGRLREDDWDGNANNSRDMWAWVEYPWSAMTTLILRGDMKFDLSRKDVRGYWDSVYGTETAWRAEWEPEFPEGRDSGEAALFVLDQALRFFSEPAAGEISDWIPELLERASGLESGKSVLLPAEPSPRDLVILRAFPLAGPRRTRGGWALVVR